MFLNFYKKTYQFLLAGYKQIYYLSFSVKGAIAQLVERNAGSVEVGGSRPPGSTLRSSSFVLLTLNWISVSLSKSTK